MSVLTKPAAFTFCKVGTIREIHQQLLHDGYRVSQYALRQWIKSGDIPAVYAGNKALISYCNVLNILQTGNLSPTHNQQ